MILSTMTLSIMKLSLMTLRIMKLSITTPSMITPYIKALSLMIFRIIGLIATHNIMAFG
jgi:hypothetical protein